MKARRIPFDSVTLAAVVAELRSHVGGRVGKAVQTDAMTLLLPIGRERLLLSADAEFFRAHLTAGEHEAVTPAPAFTTIVRSNLQGAVLVAADQVGSDRILELTFHAGKPIRLIAELMGKHSNVILVDSQRKVIGCLKAVGKSKSKRPILPGLTYTPPPISPMAFSPFVSAYAAAAGIPPSDVARQPFAPEWNADSGAFPYPLAPLGIKGQPAKTVSEALDHAFAIRIARHEVEQLRSRLLSQLDRILLARETAIHGLEESLSTAAKAERFKRFGELILAYQHTLAPEQEKLECPDYDGTPITIALNPELTSVENAKRWFDKARHAQDAEPMARQRLAMLSDDRAAILEMLRAVPNQNDLAVLRSIEREARDRKFLHEQIPTEQSAQVRWDGKRIREIDAPGGFKVLYGENAEANDYLTTRLAKPDDLWLHVRGATSAHVVIPTQRKPERVPRDVLLFAATVAVRNSAQKHSAYVPVDYTLKKHVRKPRGSAAGSVVYTHEKTVHVEKV